MSAMREVANGVRQLTTSVFVHSYLASDVLIETGLGARRAGC